MVNENSSVFSIRKLQCEYTHGQKVLYVDSLELPAGKLAFVIGRSGVGKSTFIETLGLMNRTIANLPETSIMFSPHGGIMVELSQSWSLADVELSALRRQHFSFIFQNTNLMPNFTAGENMMMSLLIEGRTEQLARKTVYEMMESVSLPKSVFGKKVTEVSGGQRQRLAFVRAISADFSVLFGDEPTGNLDRKTSEELMAMLKDSLRGRKKSAVIVSHDLLLAEAFADLIIPIVAKDSADGNSFGVIMPDQVVYHENEKWTTATGGVVPNIAAYLNHFLVD